MSSFINCILLGVILVVLYFCLKKYQGDKIELLDVKNVFGTFGLYDNKTADPPKKIVFNYNDNVTNKIIDQYNKEQDLGVQTRILYDNNWIEDVIDDEPQYNNRSNNLMETKAIYDRDMYKLPFENIDGAIDINDIPEDKIGKPIRQIYDDSIRDFRKLVPKKKMISSTTQENITYHSGASNLNYITPDNWVYEKEKPENGGQILDGLYASDPETFDANAMF